MRKNPYFIAIIISLLFYVAFAFAFMVFANVTDSNEWSDRFSLGQFLVEICLVPIAITGFVVTITELRKSQQKASLDLSWMISENELSKSVSFEYPKSANFHTPPIILTNDGNAPSIQYQVNLEYPLSFGRAKMMSHEWKHASHQVHKFIFRSAAQYIAFPEDKIELDKMEFLDPSQLPEKTVIRYRIFSDIGEYKEGHLTIKFQKAG